MANKVDDVVFATYPDLKNKVVSLTGIGQSGDTGLEIWGNGASMARVMAHQGAKVFGCDLNLEAALRTQRRLNGAEINVTQANLTLNDDVKRAVDECMKKYGRIDVLINNVGRSERGDPSELTEEVWDDQTNINLKSVYLTCHHILPIMEKQGSGAVIGKPQVAYSATKAVISAKKGVRLNLVIPGLMYTPLVTVLADKYAYGDLDGFIQKRHDAVPTGRMGDGMNIAMAVTFLASPQSQYITGRKILVDGGITSATA
ncbi:hypothetical protein N7488_005177 [Penicillium malachiteum]|nr:hypothetical protein N7488_005177 [Penicillium malachiteum]